MVFGLGPVVRYELITTARRGRFYIARMVYGLALLFLLWDRFQEFNASHPEGGTPEQVQTFAESTFISFAGAQGAALLCLIPALVAGVIADEHQRKTLHYLLASRLSSAEIVLGKLGARVVHIATFVALGIPVVCLLALYGGLNPDNVFYVYLGTLAIAIFSSGLSILISVMARRPRDAILVTYGVGALWLLVPTWLGPTAHYMSGSLWWVGPVNDCLLMTNPLVVWGYATNQIYIRALGGLRPAWFLGQFTWAFYWMVGLQSVLGLLFVALAVLGLRPMRGSSWPGGEPQKGWWSRLIARLQAITRARVATSLTRNQLLIAPPDRAPCGDDPMLWKERFTRMGGGLKWLGSRSVALFFIVFLFCYLFDVAAPAVGGFTNRLWQARTWSTWFEMNAALRTSSAILAALAMLPISAAAAASVTSEREQDTWTSLATTLLTPVEVIRGKQFGSIWSARWLGIGLVGMLGTGLLLGAFHPLGLLAALAVLAASSWLSAAIGVLASTLARNSTRAAFFTFFAMFVFVWTSGWPSVFWQTLASYADMRYLWSGEVPVGYSRRNVVAPPLLGAAVLSAVDSILAGLLTLWSIKRLAKTWGRG
jgi:ABC-type transport system involved in multi-copper enzyme maturation permease subunit